jgi:hypothetical protein
MDILLSATAGSAATAAPAGWPSGPGFLPEEVHSKKLLSDVFGAAIRTGRLRVLFFFYRHPFFKDMGAPPAEIFIRWHLHHLF